MATCVVCGRKAGFFTNVHTACLRAEEAKKRARHELKKHTVPPVSLGPAMVDLVRRRGEILKPVTEDPWLGSVNGLGIHLYGAKDYDAPTDSTLSTAWLTVFWLPICPVARYRVIRGDTEMRGLGIERRYVILGQAPLRRVDWLVPLFTWPAVIALSGLLCFRD